MRRETYLTGIFTAISDTGTNLSVVKSDFLFRFDIQILALGSAHNGYFSFLKRDGPTPALKIEN